MDHDQLQSYEQNLHPNLPEQLLIHDSTFNPVDINLDSPLPYSMYRKFKRAHQEFTNNFINNSFGHPRSVRGRL
jgi:hypothetical protein